MINIEDEFNSHIEEVNFDLELIKNNIPSQSSQKLCEMIVCARYFGFNAELDVFCMEELAKRRINGDNFNFELKIEEATKELPALDFSATGFDIRKILTAAMGNK